MDTEIRAFTWPAILRRINSVLRLLLSVSSSDHVLGFVSQLISEPLGQDNFPHAVLRALHSSVTWQKNRACHPSLVIKYIIIGKSENDISDDTKSDFRFTIIRVVKYDRCL